MLAVQRGELRDFSRPYRNLFSRHRKLQQRRWSSFSEASSYEKIVSELFSGIWGPDCRYRCNGLDFRPKLGTVRTSPSSVGISCARPNSSISVGGESKLIAAAQVVPPSCSNRGLVFMVQ